MALQSSGTISIDDIRTELGLTSGPYSLGSMSDSVGFSAPDAISDFYGYNSAYTTFNCSDRYSNNTQACASLSTSNTYSHDGSGTYPAAGDTVWKDTTQTNLAISGDYKLANGQYMRLLVGSVQLIGNC